MSFKRLPNIIIKVDNLNEDVKLLIEEIRPNWNKDSLQIKTLQGGYSNLLFGVYSDDVFTSDTDMVLIRIYGELLLDRDLEIESMTALSKLDLAAKVWAKFGNGCCYQFIHGTTVSIEDLRDEKYIPLIIQEFVKLHTAKLELNRPNEPFLFPKMKEMAHQLPDNINNLDKNERYLLEYPNRSAVFQEIEILEKHLVKHAYPVAFCHNDLLANNLVLNTNKDRIHLIDFEYAEYNYCAYDIGNHFNEFAGFDTLDYSLYPDKVFQKTWIRKFLETRLKMHKLNGYTENGERHSITESEVEDWYKMVNKFALASNLFWSIWSIWQEQNSTISFDYLNYAIERWNEYKRRKDEFLAL